MTRTFKIYFYSIIVTLCITQGAYYIQTTYMLHSNYFDTKLSIPIIMGLIVGGIIGKLRSQFVELNKNRSYKSLLKKQELLIETLTLSKQEADIVPLFDIFLEIIINIPSSKTKAKAKVRAAICIFDGDGLYEVTNKANYEEAIPQACITTSKINIDDKSQVYHTCDTYDLDHHKHYNIPIVYKDNTYGLLMLSLEIDHEYDQSEVDFLSSVANILAMNIHRDKSDKLIKEKDTELSALSSAEDIVKMSKWSYDVVKDKICISDDVLLLLGYDPKTTIISKYFSKEIIYPEDKHLYFTALNNAVKGTPFRLEIRYVSKKGEIKHIINQCTPHLNKKGKVEKLAGFLFDITSVRESEEQLQESEHFIDNIVSASPYSLYLLDIINNKILYTNANSKHPIIAKVISTFGKGGIYAWREFYHPKDKMEFLHKIDDVIIGNKNIYEFNARCLNNDNEYTWLNQKFKPFKKDKNGNVTQLLCVNIDIQKLKIAEDKIYELNNELLSQNEELIKINSELDKFIYSSAHDLRAPVATILGITQLYTKESKLEMKDKYMEYVDTSAKKLDNVIHEINQYSKNSKLDIYIEKIDLGKLVEEIFEGQKKIFPTNTSELKLYVDEQVVISSDLYRTSIILNNIIENALKYSDSTVTKSVITCKIAYQEDGAIVQVIDNGIGIDSKYLSKVFDMFYRAENTQIGSGLGLYITKEAVAKVSGTIDIQSEKGISTEVNVFLPNL